MEHLQQYLTTISRDSHKESIMRTSSEVVSIINGKIIAEDQLTGLLLGNVQSGKTAQMFGVISLLADQGYNIFILLTTDNVDLQR